MQWSVCNFSSFVFHCRVEDEGKAIITDVIYQSKTSHHDKTTGDKKQYDKLQDEIKELVEKEQLLSFKLDVIEKQKSLLNKFADQICRFSESKVRTNIVTDLINLNPRNWLTPSLPKLQTTHTIYIPVTTQQCYNKPTDTN